MLYRLALIGAQGDGRFQNNFISKRIAASGYNFGLVVRVGRQWPGILFTSGSGWWFFHRFFFCLNFHRFNDSFSNHSRHFNFDWLGFCYYCFGDNTRYLNHFWFAGAS